jgi:hypothetical protein
VEPPRSGDARVAECPRDAIVARNKNGINEFADGSGDEASSPRA